MLESAKNKNKRPHLSKDFCAILIQQNVLENKTSWMQYPFKTPTKGAGKIYVLLARNIKTLNYIEAINDREHTVALSSEHIIFHHLLQRQHKQARKDLFKLITHYS